MRIRAILLSMGAILGLFAQGERGTFNGTVTDPSGSSVPGATVRAVATATNVETTATTTAAGIYRMPYLQPGNYKISATAPGFKSAVRENVILSVAQTLTVDFIMEVGQVTDSITISSEPPLLETGTAEIGSYVSKKEFDTWPITVGDGRRQIQEFIFSSLPGTVGGTFEGSINGGQYYSHEILIDGIALGRMDLQGGSNNEFSPSAESVSEFKLQTGTVSAQYSGAQTSVANFATKSGTNELHGSAYYYVQNDAFRANGWGNNASGIKRQPFKQHNYGYSAGGPLLLPKIYNGKNKTFWYHNYERTKQRNFISTSFTQLPTRDFKQGDFSRLFSSAFTGNSASGTMAGTDQAGQAVRFGAIYDPNTTRAAGSGAVRDVFPGNIVPRSRWSPVSQKILDVGIDDPLFDQMLLNMPALGTCCPFFDEHMLTVKGDHHFNSSHKFSALYNRNFRERNNSPGGRWGVPPGLPTNVYQLQKTPGSLGRVAYDTTITPTLLNHFAIGYNRFGNNNESVYVDQDWPSKLGLQNVPGTHFPVLTFGGQPHQGNNYGASGRLSSGNRGGSYNGSTIFQDDLTHVRGRHNFKFGFEHRRYYYNTRGKNGSGDFAFSPLQTSQIGFNNQTGHSFASFLLGAVSTTSRGIASTFGHRWRSLGFYAMDDWKVNKKLTLNLGLRWEVIGALSEVAGRMSGLGFGTANPVAGGRPGGLVFTDDLGRTSFQNRYPWQISPKFGFAYAINEKLVVRGGYGINNTPPISNGFGFGAFTEGFSSSIARNAGNTALRFAEDPVMYLHDRYPDQTFTLPNRNPSQVNGRGINYMASDSNRLAYTQNWNLGFQFQLPRSFVLETNYIGNKGTRLEANGLDDLNALPVSVLARGNSLQDPWSAASGIPQPFPGFVGTNVQALRPYPQFTAISQPFANFGTSFYNSAQVQLTRHFKSGLAVLAAYTWSKALGLNNSAIDSDGAADVFNRSLERMVLGYHFPHFAKLTWIYELPIGNNKLINVPGIAGKIIGGWNITGIHQFRSGSVLGVSGGAVTNPLGLAARPDIVPGKAIILSSDAPKNFGGRDPNAPRYLNRDAFALVPVHPGGRNNITRLGTAPQNLPNIRGPHLISENLALEKTWNFTETKSFGIRGTFLNPFNKVARGNPNTDLGSPLFGMITGSQFGGRNLELSARVTF